MLVAYCMALCIAAFPAELVSEIQRSNLNDRESMGEASVAEKEEVNILWWYLTSLMVEISNLQATGINEFFRGLCSRQCHSTGNNFGCMTFITWPPLVHSWVARKLFASIDTLRLSHLYGLCFTVWDFTSSLFSRRLVRVQARERGLQPALRRALWERKGLPVCYPVPA